MRIMTRRYEALALVALSMGAACVSPLRIAGAACPCPDGYCCSTSGMCEPDPTWPVCGAARSGGVSDAGQGDGGADSQPLPPAMLLPGSGDEAVVAFVPGGKSLVTLSRPTADSTRGELSVHDEIGNFGQSGAIVDRSSVQLADGVVLGPSVYWTSGGKFVPVDQPLAVSRDGRFLAEARSTTAGDVFVDIVSTTAVFSAAMNRFVPTPIRSEPLRGILRMAQFSPDGTSAFLPGEGSAGLVRAPTTSAGDSVVLDTNVSPYGGVQFAGAADAVWQTTMGIYLWRGVDPAPSLIASLDSPVDELLGVVGDEVYFSLGVNSTAGAQTHRISLTTGQRETVAGPALNNGGFSVASPDGKYAVIVRSDAIVAIDLTSGTDIAQVDTCYGDLPPRSPPTIVPPPPIQVLFLPDSRTVVATRFTCISTGERMSFSDVATMDLATGTVTILKEQAYEDQVYLLDAQNIVFTTPSNPGATTSPPQFDLVMATLHDQTRLLATGVDRYIAVDGHTIAFSRHGPDPAGVFTLAAP
jgi:hypothetical protein